MNYGFAAAITWGIETVVLGLALAMAPFAASEQAIFLAPFVACFLHDSCSAIMAGIFNGVRGNLRKVWRSLKTKSGKGVVLSAIIGGPIGMSGYVTSIHYMGAAVGSVSTAVFPAVCAICAFIFLHERLQWYRWALIPLVMLGIYGLSYSPELDIKNFWLGVAGTITCSIAWGIEAVILAKCMTHPRVKDEFAFQIRQTTSALTHAIVVMPLLGGWGMAIDIASFSSDLTMPTIALAAFFATISYFCFFRSIATIGPTKTTVINVTYAVWAILITVVILRDTSSLTPLVIGCSFVVLTCSILIAADFKELTRRNTKTVVNMKI